MSENIEEAGITIVINGVKMTFGSIEEAAEWLMHL